ncbi:MAG TPA: hypothetical protein VK718_06710 [Ferruginibacter sp.]|jgi:hypothetical protein|nr:hypothetical protein [Ferruginibacter sp.]
MIKLIIDDTVGYMLKVLKSGRPIITYKKEFALIRHGNYYEFINLIGEPIPFIIMYNRGVITEETEAREDDIDFAGLLKAGPSLLKFYQECKRIYGEVKDNDITDEVYKRVVLFEIGLRMHAQNNNLLNEKEELINVIIKICDFKKLPQEEIEVLQKGRQFLNMVKHNKGQFNSWKEGLVAFHKAYEISNKYKMTVI